MAVIAFDVETNAKDPRSDPSFKVLGVSYASSRDMAGYIPAQHYGLPDSALALCVQRLRSLMEDHSQFVFHNAKFDICCLQRIGLDFWDLDWYDTMLMQHFIDENLPNKSLDYLGKLYFNEGKEKSEEFTNLLNTFGWAFMPQWMIEPYAIQDARLTLRIFNLLISDFRKQGFLANTISPIARSHSL